MRLSLALKPFAPFPSAFPFPSPFELPSFDLPSLPLPFPLGFPLSFPFSYRPEASAERLWNLRETWSDRMIWPIMYLISSSYTTTLSDITFGSRSSGSVLSLALPCWRQARLTGPFHWQQAHRTTLSDSKEKKLKKCNYFWTKCVGLKQQKSDKQKVRQKLDQEDPEEMIFLQTAFLCHQFWAAGFFLVRCVHFHVLSQHTHKSKKYPVTYKANQKPNKPNSMRTNQLNQQGTKKNDVDQAWPWKMSTEWTSVCPCLVWRNPQCRQQWFWRFSIPSVFKTSFHAGFPLRSTTNPNPNPK